jgi:hypothetical protein
LSTVRNHFEVLHEQKTEWLHERDVRILLRDSRYLSRFVQRSGNNVERAIQVTEQILRWRGEQLLPTLDFRSFPREFFERKLIYVHGFDRKGHLIVFARVKLFVKSFEFKEMFNIFLPFLYYAAMDLAVNKGASF